jgi:nucleoside-diphosphate-sugar epimerase
VDGLIKLMDCSYDKPVNLGCPDERSIEDIAQLIIKLTNSRSRIIYKPLPEDDPIRRKPDITLANKILNWCPNIKIEDGLRITINYFRSLDNKHSLKSLSRANSIHHGAYEEKLENSVL